MGLVTAEIDAGKKEDILRKLKSLGEVREKDKAAEYHAGPVSLKIEVLAGP